MTKLKLIIALVFICFLNNLYVTAQDTKVKHNILIWGSGGLSSLKTDATTLTPLPNAGFGLGAGYELHYKSFMLQTGAELGYYNTGLQLPSFTQDIYNMTDTEGDTYTGHYQFSKNQDLYKLGNINIPLMVGAQFGNIFFLAGGKLGLNLMGSSTTQTLVVSSGIYPQFIDTIRNQPDHGFTQVLEKANYPLKLALNCSLSGEAGIYLGSAPTATSSNDGKPKYRLSVFYDYGLFNVHNNNSVSQDLWVSVAGADLNLRGLNSFMLSTPFNKNVVNTIYAGVKFSVLFGFKGKPDCHCNDFAEVKQPKKVTKKATKNKEYKHSKRAKRTIF